MGHFTGLLAPVLVVAALAACRGDNGGEASEVSTSTAPSTTVAPVTLPRPAPANPTIIPLSDRLETRFDILGGPGWLAAGAGSVWVKRDHGSVVRIDPETNEIVAEIEVYRLGLCQGLGADEEAVWTCRDRHLVRIDPSTNEIAATIPVGVVAIDPETAEVLGTVDASAGNGGSMAADEDALWSRSGAFLRRVDAETLAVTEEITAPETGPGEALIAFGSVWASAYDEAVVYRLSLD